MATRIFSVTVHSKQGDEFVCNQAKANDATARGAAIKAALRNWNQAGSRSVLTRYSEKDIA